MTIQKFSKLRGYQRSEDVSLRGRKPQQLIGQKMINLWIDLDLCEDWVMKFESLYQHLSSSDCQENVNWLPDPCTTVIFTWSVLFELYIEHFILKK
ncbi:hypothetical protein L195_g059745 [Trifolium pratense]|uniref:Uncharacterized protein n=1 Tax=Trifolium pratense TaxID=57577 RepID=A0A2K3JZZ5_TRIPR|nr:hypothetical protein L195_g059745 [Trifolium pratense]